MSAPTGKLKLAYQSLAAAEARETALREDLSTANRTIASMLKNGWAELDDAKHRLTAADERVDELERDKARIDWLTEQPVDTLYLDDGRIIDIAGRIDLRDAIDAAMAALKPAEAHPCPVHLDGCDGSCKP